MKIGQKMQKKQKNLPLREKLNLLPATNIIVPVLWQVLSVLQCLFLLLKMKATAILLMLPKMKVWEKFCAMVPIAKK